MKNCTVGLLGNPNTGKSTLFNQLTGARQSVGNWEGVTVERKEGFFTVSNTTVNLIDLPGTYSLTTISQQASIDEQITCNFVLKRQADLLINVVDACNLERNLYLTIQLRELGIPFILALNMLDLAEKQSITIDIVMLSKLLGCPVVPVVSTRGRGLKYLKQLIDKGIGTSQTLQIDYPTVVNTAADRLIVTMSTKECYQYRRWMALQLLEGDLYIREQVSELTLQQLAMLNKLNNTMAIDLAVEIAAARYRQLTAICVSVSNQHVTLPHQLSQWLDHIVLNRWLGIPIFLLTMYMMFLLAINIGGALQPIFDISSAAIFIHGVQWFGYTLHFPSWLTLFLAQGIGGGINTILPLVPQICLMYLFLALMEDSGYIARAAFVIDRLMQSLGLPGKSFVPLIVGFGCNVPAVIGARRLDTQRERLITIMMAPFMSCGARLAIFAVFSAAFFRENGSLIIFCLYLTGIVLAIFTGLLLRHTLLRGEATPFVMELPNWHVPHMKSIMLQTWQRLRSFVIRAGKVIIIANVLISGLNSFSLHGKPVNTINNSALASISQVLTPLLVPIGIQPDNWQATIGLITGAMSKEIVVSTLNTLYAAEELQKKPYIASNWSSIMEELSNALVETWYELKRTLSFSVLANPIKVNQYDSEIVKGAMGQMHQKFSNDAAVFSYLLFILLYIPCVSVMGAISRESSRCWMGFSIFWGLNVAYSVATLFWQFTCICEQPMSSCMTIMLVLLFNSILLFILRRSYTPLQRIPIKCYW